MNVCWYCAIKGWLSCKMLAYNVWNCWGVSVKWYHLYARIQIIFTFWLMLSRFQKVKNKTSCLIAHLNLLIWHCLMHLSGVRLCVFSCKTQLLSHHAHGTRELLLLGYLLDYQLELDFTNVKSPCSLHGFALLSQLSLVFLMP